MQGATESAVRPMEYPVLQTSSGASGILLPETAAPERSEQEEALARQLEAVRCEAIDQGRRMATSESSAWRQQRAAELRTAIEAFASSLDTYLAQVEKEVVGLALAIAERILHRESQLDPLLLSGAVRMALGQLADSAEVRLRVPADQRELWADVVRLMPGLSLRPEVAAEPELSAGAVVLESSLGTVDLSVRAQLEEIGRGFFDRVETGSDSDRQAGGRNQ